ncbi:flagellar assembly protein FliX [Devosia soli]|nr:flagellar assembly protein FliX [Devosia soli]
MRIESANRMASVSSRASVGKYAAGQTFSMSDVAGPARVARAAPVAQVAALDAILALQSVGDAMGGKRKAVKRGTALLDLLDGIKADILVGGITAERLDALVEELSVYRDRTEPGLDSLLDDIELRVRVELAKQGRFPEF